MVVAASAERYRCTFPLLGLSERAALSVRVRYHLPANRPAPMLLHLGGASSPDYSTLCGLPCTVG